MKDLVFKQKGIGLIEVLVALVIVSLGLLSLAVFQGQLLSSSGQNKARSEALSIAQNELEHLRQEVQLGNTAPSLSSPTNPFQGTNALYNISFTKTANASPSNTEKLTVTVAWLDQHVSLSTNVATTSPQLSISYASKGNGLNGLAPSPNNNSSVVSARVFVNSDGTPKSGTSLNDGSGLATIQDGNDLYLIDPTTGISKIKFTGGVIHTVKGTVYVENGNSGVAVPSSVYPVAFSDLGYCEFPLPGTTAQYICYFGGDCSKGGAGCSSGSTYQDIQGGWYGKVGLLETSANNFQNKKVCFGEDVNGSGIDTVTTTARTYAARRVNPSNNAINSEGFNQSMSCQNFLVVNKSGNSYPCGSVASASAINVPGSAMLRVLGYTSGVADPNVSLPEDTSQCSSEGSLSNYVVQGTISGSYAQDVVVTLGGQQCLIKLQNGIYSYYCEINTNTGAPDLVAYGGNVTPAKVTGVSSGSTHNLSTGAAVLPSTSYVLNGNLYGNQASNVQVSVNGGSCSEDYAAGTYSCSLTTTATQAQLTAVNNSTGTVNPQSANVSLGGLSPVTGPDFTGLAPITSPVTYSITGPISGAKAKNTTVSYIDSAGASQSCTQITSGKGNSSTYTFQCSVTTTATSVTLQGITNGGGTVTPSSIDVALNPSVTNMTLTSGFVAN